jgi:hypothetical protein
MQQRRATVREALLLQAGEHVLDIGTGPGFEPYELATVLGPTGHLHAIDTSDVMLQLSRQRCIDQPWVEFQSADATLLPFDDTTFDAAVVVVARFASVLLLLANPSKSTGPVAHPTQTQFAPSATNPSPTTTPSPVLVYFSKNPESLNAPTAVFPVQQVAPNSAVATFAIQQLIAGPTSSEAAAGYFTELTNVLQLSGPSNCGGADFKLTLDMRGATPQVGTATLQLCRPTASPGIGADGRIVAEVTKTLTQFSTITKVAILNRNGNCFGDESGLDLCLK